MNSLEDLRSTLDQHAAGVDDPDRYARPVAVRERIRAVRRRRASAVVAAAAVVLVGAVATVSGLQGSDSVDPAGPTVVGIDVPKTWTIDEFPYSLEETTTFAGDRDKVRLTGDEDDPDRAVAFYARGLGSGSATLYNDGVPVARAFGEEDAELPVPVASTDTALSVRFEGVPAGARTGLAVYTATGELPEGVDNGTAVFRQVVAGAELLTGDFSPEGQSEVSFTFRGRLDQARFATYCVTAEKGLWFNLDIDGDGPVSGPCEREDSRDAGASWSSFPDETGFAAVHTVSAYLTRGDSDERVSSPDASVGAAVYRQPVDDREVGGTSVDGTTSYGGRTWRLTRVLDRDRASIEAGATDLLIGFAAQGEMVYLSWEGELTSGRSAYVSSTRGTATAIGGVLLRGDTYDVRLIDEQGTLRTGAILVYRPV